MIDMLVVVLLAAGATLAAVWRARRRGAQDALKQAKENDDARAKDIRRRVDAARERHADGVQQTDRGFRD